MPSPIQNIRSIFMTPEDEGAASLSWSNAPIQWNSKASKDCLATIKEALKSVDLKRNLMTLVIQTSASSKKEDSTNVIALNPQVPSTQMPPSVDLNFDYIRFCNDTVTITTGSWHSMHVILVSMSHHNIIHHFYCSMCSIVLCHHTTCMRSLSDHCSILWYCI